MSTALAIAGTALQIFVGLLFMTSGVIKLYGRKDFRATLREFVWLPGKARSVLLLGIPCSDVLIGLLLVTDTT